MKSLTPYEVAAVWMARGLESAGHRDASDALMEAVREGLASGEALTVLVTEGPVWGLDPLKKAREPKKEEMQ